MLIPTSAAPKVGIEHFDKAIHLIIYFIFVLIWATYLFKFYKKINYVNLFLALLFIYGIVIEILQERFIPTRSFDFWDIIANTLGILIGFVLWYKWRKNILVKN